MSSIVTKVLIGALATFGSVYALPQGMPVARDVTDNSVLIKDLRDAPTQVKKWQKLFTEKTADGSGNKLLSSEKIQERTVFDFNKIDESTRRKGGVTKSANVESFPMLTGLGISTTVGFIEACGMNTPHVHPRATEFLTVVEGSMIFGEILENAIVSAKENAEISGQLDKYQGTVFPMGSIHYQFNPNCEKAHFVATLDHEDPGTGQAAQGYFGLDGDVVKATLGFGEQQAGTDLNEFRNRIPANIALGVQQCLQKCEIQRESQNQ